MLDAEKDKLYVIRKYVKAGSVAQALKRERRTKVHEVFLDEKWQEKHLPEAVGFKTIEQNL